MLNITAELFHRLYPNATTPQQWADALNTYLPQYGIDTLVRYSAFLAQCGHESQGFTRIAENLNYSADALMRTWPKRFPPEIAHNYARKPESIANRAYANRMGNGPEESGDGWKYRGKGCIQLTGKDNQAAFAKHAGIDLEVIGGYLLTIEGAVHSACWFWREHGCNVYADRNDIIGCTKAINGGLIGLKEREHEYKHISSVFGIGGTNDA